MLLLKANEYSTGMMCHSVDLVLSLEQASSVSLLLVSNHGLRILGYTILRASRGRFSNLPALSAVFQRSKDDDRISF